MNLIVITDIFGKTPALKELLDSFSTRYQTIQVVDPYAGRQFNFQSEAEAYSAFKNQCGLEQLITILQQTVKNTLGPCDLIGFSVGATATWELTGQPAANKICSAVCFYGSRIREKTDIEPSCPTTLILPCQEESFEVGQLIPLLTPKSQVKIIETDYLHGFMNKLSCNYSPNGFLEFSNWLLKRMASP